MKNFYRSLRYLWPYRRTLAISIVCVIFISVLWGGGLGMAAPVLKVLMDPQGLHGWAWSKVVDDGFQAQIVQQPLSDKTRIEAKRLSSVLHVVSVDDDGTAKSAGIVAMDWIVGIDDGDESHRIMDAPDAARALAHLEPGQAARVRLYDQANARMRTVEVTLAPLGLEARILARVANAVPEPETYSQRFNIFLGLLAVVVIVTVLRNLLRFFQEYMVQSAVLRAIMDIRCENYNATLRLPVTFFATHGTSDTTSRFVKDTNVLTIGHVTLFGKTLAEPGKAIGALAMAFYFSWELTLLAMIAGPPVMFLIRKLGKRMRKAAKRALEGWSSILAILEETLLGIRVVKAYTMEGGERKRFFQSNRRLLKQQRKIAKINSASSPAVEAIGITAAMLAAAVAGHWVLQQKMDMVNFAACMACLAATFDPVRKLSKVVTRFHQADAAATRIFELMDRQKEVSLPNAPMLPRHCRSIELRDVSFRYPRAGQDSLSDINLDIRAGETLAIVGPNGSGKTTMVSLLPRLIDPDRGQVLIDGEDISRYSIRSLRRQIALVTQETVIFHATIAENIAYGLRRPKHERVMAAARQGFVDEFVRDMPEGFDTLVGEHGATLSGGQRQRIAIARAILRDPAILIFDEATSQVDGESERRIQEAMAEFVKGRTTLMIAHRFATVLAADRIVVMNEGRIVDCDTHAELLTRCDLYNHLYKTQFLDDTQA